MILFLLFIKIHGLPHFRCSYSVSKIKLNIWHELWQFCLTHICQKLYNQWQNNFDKIDNFDKIEIFCADKHRSYNEVQNKIRFLRTQANFRPMIWNRSKLIRKMSEGSTLCYFIAIFEKVSHTLLVNLLLNENIFIRYGFGLPVYNLCGFFPKLSALPVISDMFQLNYSKNMSKYEIWFANCETVLSLPFAKIVAISKIKQVF